MSSSTSTTRRSSTSSPTPGSWLPSSQPIRFLPSTAGDPIYLTPFGQAAQISLLSPRSRSYPDGALGPGGRHGPQHPPTWRPSSMSAPPPPSSTSAPVPSLPFSSFYREFHNELHALSTVPSFPFIVSLLGYCLESPRHHLLVYEYMPNGSLQETLFSVGSPECPSIVPIGTPSTVREVASSASTTDRRATISPDLRSPSPATLILPPHSLRQAGSTVGRLPAPSLHLLRPATGLPQQPSPFLWPSLPQLHPTSDLTGPTTSHLP